MLNERAIINVLILLASCVIVPFLIYSTLTIDYGPVLFFGGLAAILISFFLLRDMLSVCPLLGIGVSGALNFLPLPLNASHIACIMLILYFITGYVAIRQSSIKMGKRMLLFPLLVIAFIVVYHDHSIGLHIAGSSTEGGKPAFFVMLGIVAYFCGINIKSPSIKFLSTVPFWFVILALISSIPFFLSTYIPSLAPYLYVLTDNVNVNAYLETQAGSKVSEGEIGRFGAFGMAGTALELYLLCHYPIGTWWRPNRWWVAGLSLVCAGLAVLSGFRNTLFSFVMLIMVATWCHYSWRSFFLPVAVVVFGGLLAIVAANNLLPIPVNKLPLIAQRTMSFLPGDWDQEALDAAESSNHFRKNIQDVYIKEYLDKSPLLGNGFEINTDEYQKLKDGSQNSSDPEYNEAKLFIVGKMFHTGWISVYDIVGLVGSLAFVILGWNEIKLISHLVFASKAGRKSPLYPLYVWLTCNIVTMMVSFFTVFGDFSGTFFNLCVYGIVLSQLYDIEDSAESSVMVPAHSEPAVFPALRGALSDYHSRPRY